MIHLYAEHLHNIKTLSIQALLSTVSNKETKATLSADGSTLTLSHEGETASIQLPINLSPNKESNATITIPAVPSKQLTFRVQLEEKENSNTLLNGHSKEEEGDIVPWTAGSLTDKTELQCRNCLSVLVERGQIKVWKDLPSEGWAEFMEFWHCHKPHDHDEAHGDLKKGYAADSTLALESGVGMCDAMELVFLADDCRNVDISHDSPYGLKCAHCTSVLGEEDPLTGGYKLRKPCLSVSTHPNTASRAYTTSKWLSALLLTAAENQSVRKFIARDPSNDAIGLKLWIFAPSLTISSSARSSSEPVRVAKVMWRDYEIPSEGEGGDDRLNSAALAEGELKLRKEEMDALWNELARGGAWIPEGSRLFQEWRVGLLERFTREDVEGEGG